MSQVQNPTGARIPPLISNDLANSFLPIIRKIKPIIIFKPTCNAMQTPAPIAMLKPLFAASEPVVIKVQ
ncbi:hypothetical protein [Pedobacter boryungensis]|uniref:Uncharacterized protein n=1 Tax=Pedobacter boryungensis TaxID=869962 RepID=A0ABX2DD78_9SPHI|nr:hypothetical protein [Pedobacter boryungensis]NQX31099.1 hypothetical protein [Pedobacter boryungensis]